MLKFHKESDFHLPQSQNCSCQPYISFDIFFYLYFVDCQDVYANHGGKNYPGFSYIMPHILFYILPYIALFLHITLYILLYCSTYYPIYPSILFYILPYISLNIVLHITLYIALYCSTYYPIYPSLYFPDCQDVYENHGGKKYPGFSYIMSHILFYILPYISLSIFSRLSGCL